jgi:hypothetical protein
MDGKNLPSTTAVLCSVYLIGAALRDRNATVEVKKKHVKTLKPNSKSFAKKVKSAATPIVQCTATSSEVPTSRIHGLRGKKRYGSYRKSVVLRLPTSCVGKSEDLKPVKLLPSEEGFLLHCLDQV